MLKHLQCIVLSAAILAPVAVWADAGATNVGGATSTGTNSNTVPENPSNSRLAAEQMVDDKSFVMDSASGGMLEVQLGQLVQQRGQSDIAKNFAKMMVEDHTKANEQLMALAKQKNIEVSKELNEKDRATLEKMQKLNGMDLDRTYLANMVEDHQKDISAAEKEAKNGKDADVKAFAQQVLPIFRNHLQHATTAVAQIKGSDTDKAQPAGGKVSPDKVDANTKAGQPRDGTQGTK